MSVCCACFFYFKDFSDENQKGLELVSSDAATKPRPEGINVPAGPGTDNSDMILSETVPISNNQLDKERKPLISEYEASEIKKWHEARGYFDDHELGDYLTYDVATLEKLSLADDMKAIQLLAFEKLKQGDYSSTYELYLKAASLGSTNALAAASSVRISQASREDNTKQKEIYLLDAFSLLGVAVKRNDIVITDSYIQTTKDINRVTLTPAQEETVIKMTDKLYKDLLAKRAEKGLGRFDNSVTSGVATIIANIKK